MVKMSESKKILDKYEKLIGTDIIKRIREKAEPLKNKKIFNVNATKFGGGVAEILQNMVPLMRELNLDANWEAFSASQQFFEISKRMHNALQGNKRIKFSENDKEIFLGQAKASFEQLKPRGDFIIIHDPQPCPIINHAVNRKGKWIWRCHIDTSDPNEAAWDLVEPYIKMYDALIFTMKEYLPRKINKPIFQISPSIDPFSPKNQDMDEETAKSIVGQFVKLDKPLITQVSRFDPWKDPLGVIDAFKLAKKSTPMRLALVGSLALDDPEGQELLAKINNYSKDDPDIITLSNLDGVHDREVNAFQRISDVILQKSIKEGFGLTVTEALWKETPVIGGNVGGIKLQIDDGINGFLVNTIEETAEKIVYLIEHPKEAKEIGKKGRLKVKDNFLLINHLEKYLDLFNSLL